MRSENAKSGLVVSTRTSRIRTPLTMTDVAVASVGPRPGGKYAVIVKRRGVPTWAIVGVTRKEAENGTRAATALQLTTAPVVIIESPENISLNCFRRSNHDRRGCAYERLPVALRRATGPGGINGETAERSAVFICSPLRGGKGNKRGHGWVTASVGVNDRVQRGYFGK